MSTAPQRPDSKQVSGTVSAPAQVLACPMPGNGADAATVRDYLTALVARLWDEDEEFSGKRPFGDSGWRWEVTGALVAAGLAADDTEADALVRAAIRTV